MHVIIFSVGSQTLTLFSKTVSKFLPLDGKLHPLGLFGTLPADSSSFFPQPRHHL